jgi:DNA-binding HxlR family transcriptional regulator
MTTTDDLHEVADPGDSDSGGPSGTAGPGTADPSDGVGTADLGDPGDTADPVDLSDLAGPRACSVARTLELVGERWALLALREVFLGVRRFDAIQRNTGAPRDILSARLRKLVDSGLLRRSQYQDRPVRFEYRLTEAGRDLLPVLLTLMHFGDQHLTEGDPPMTYRHVCGAELTPVVVCACCGQPVARRDLTPVQH